MKLWEALKISKIREAVGRRWLGDQEIMFYANDAGVSVEGSARVIQQGLIADRIVVSSWADLLPNQREIINKINWKPIDPKNALILLAEAVTDFHEDESEFTDPGVK